MIILGIETSCDETAAAVVKNGREILSQSLASSVKMHATTGGIIPEFAAREQIKSIPTVIGDATKDISPNLIDAIAVTYGPGLIGSLLVGVETAKTLSLLWKKPLIPVNHLVGHLYANFIDTSPPPFPALLLLASGGHTDLVLIKNHGDFLWLGGTRDDAAGEAFDKCARILGLGYPGGPAISKEAAKHQLPPKPFLPRPLIDDSGFDFSFSGLKTALWRLLNTPPNLRPNLSKLAFEVESSIVDVLVTKTLNAALKYRPKSILLSGGVAANTKLRRVMAKKVSGLNFHPLLYIPPPSLCTDNAVFVAAAAYYNFRQIEPFRLSPNPELTITNQN